MKTIQLENVSPSDIQNLLNRNLEKAKKIQEKFLVSEIIASENVAINHLGEEENTYYRQSICQKTVLQFIISLRETF